jgi:hypothetical protein
MKTPPKLGGQKLTLVYDLWDQYTSATQGMVMAPVFKVLKFNLIIKIN